MFIYLSCASVIPYNTGELVYVSKPVQVNEFY